LHRQRKQRSRVGVDARGEAQAPHLSSPDDIALGIARAVKDPMTPFRIAVGSGSAQRLGLGSRLTDDEWIPAAGGPTPELVERVEAADPVYCF
jgi:hypothetical protein